MHYYLNYYSDAWNVKSCSFFVHRNTEKKNTRIHIIINCIENEHSPTASCFKKKIIAIKKKTLCNTLDNNDLSTRAFCLPDKEIRVKERVLWPLFYKEIERNDKVDLIVTPTRSCIISFNACKINQNCLILFEKKSRQFTNDRNNCFVFSDFYYSIIFDFNLI